jgi:hypothetical protein
MAAFAGEMQLKPKTEVEATSILPSLKARLHALDVVSFPYAPRAGGAYDSHHRTAEIAGRARRRGSHVAAHGTRPTARDAGDRVPQRSQLTGTGPWWLRSVRASNGLAMSKVRAC